MIGKTKINITHHDGYMCLEVDGHNDDPLVCSAISFLMQTVELGFEALSNTYDSVILNVHEECE